MPILFYNTLSRKKENFNPIEEGIVKLYTCGPTVYNAAHIGNFRSFVFEDLLKRYLWLKGYKVHHVMNITDVDDKTILKSNAEQIPINVLTEKYADLFFEDLKSLKMEPADKYPLATKHIDIMIDMVQSLLKKGHAYVGDDKSIYFSIVSYPKYGKLTNLIFDSQQATDRVSQDEYSKDNPQDFVLWKAWKETDGDTWWDSPWGRGRPGWHVECSAMSIKYLGNHFDIHCGGVDNIFPHHENELAQSSCSTGSTFVNCWMHAEHLLVDSSKMSKSLGNFYRIKELLDMGFSPEGLRYILLNTHYQTKLNFSLNKKIEASKIVQRLADFTERISSLAGHTETRDLPDSYDDFVQALDNNLDTPGALAVFFEWLRKMNLRMDQNKVDSSQSAEALNFVNKFNFIFDMLPDKHTVPKDILLLAEQRVAAREKKDWNLADQIRDEISAKGWNVLDTENGFVCKPKNI